MTSTLKRASTVGQVLTLNDAQYTFQQIPSSVYLHFHWINDSFRSLVTAATCDTVAKTLITFIAPYYRYKSVQLVTLNPHIPLVTSQAFIVLLTPTDNSISFNQSTSYCKILNHCIIEINEPTTLSVCSKARALIITWSK